ncbi:MAG: hypothetical protein KDK70_37955 [Myxococcales bacterium]|nr:hypothetical protein [Myxococcales bacterium]
MMPCFCYRPRASILLLSTLWLLPGCIDPKSVGQETDDAGESSESDDTGGPTSNGSATTMPGTGTEGSGTEGSDSDSSGTDTSGLCPPIDIASCVQCDCIEGEWSCSSEGCVYDCTDQACGTACMICPEGDPDCSAPEYEGVCTADEQCVGVPPPKLGFCEGALQPGFEGALTVQAGCSDMTVYAHDAADERGVVVRITAGLVQDAVDSGLPVHAELSAVDAAVSLEARAGFSVTINECNDAPLPNEDIEETWLPAAGTVIVDVVPDGIGTANATVELSGVELHRTQPGPAPITIDMTMTDVYVGWLPG